MVTPRNINIEKDKRKAYSFRLEESILNKLHELAKLENITTPDLLKEIIAEYLEEKTVYNNYLEKSNSNFILIPYNLLSKDLLTDNEYWLTNKKEHITSYLLNTILENNLTPINTPPIDTLEVYEVAKIPNNLDIYDTTERSYRGIIGDHDGLEILIIPNVAEALQDNDNTEKFTSCLYIIKFGYDLDINYNTEVKELISITLVDYVEAFNLIGKSGNKYLENLLTTVYKKLVEAETIEEVKEIANTYNTGNVVKLSDKPTEEVKPIKLTTYANKYTIKQHDTELLERIGALERDNKKLKKALIDTYNVDMNNSILDIDDEILDLEVTTELYTKLIKIINDYKLKNNIKLKDTEAKE